MNKITAIGFTDPTLKEPASLLASKLGLKVDHAMVPRLSLMPDKLALVIKDFAPLYVDFNAPAIERRSIVGKKQALIRACKPAKGVRIIDATAGWGRDAALLAYAQAEVVMIEREPIMAALLADGLRRAPWLSNLKLINEDSKHYLQALGDEKPEVIYIDPMHPLRQKSALVKKDMQALQELIGADSDALELLQLALSVAKERVVIKWPQKLKALLPPHYSISGKTVRFDVYVVERGC
jgi:16S rRNA (guanine1516-N2)-methyltransferase